MELPAYSFALAVQYHPEELEATDEVSRRLFTAFVHACLERATKRDQNQPPTEHPELVATAMSAANT